MWGNVSHFPFKLLYSLNSRFVKRSNTMQLYRPLLKNALSITWKFKYLWFFGLFAVLMGNGGAYNYGIKNFKRVEGQGVFLNQISDAIKEWKFSAPKLSEAIGVLDFWSVAIFMMLIALAAFFVWLSVVSQGGLVYGIRQSISKRDSIFNEVFHRGNAKFWPVFLLSVILNLAVFFLYLLVSVPFLIFFMESSTLLWQNILVILSFIIFVPLAIVFAIVFQFALIYVMLEDKHISEAIGKAWSLFRKNWIISLETGLLLFLLHILTSLLMILVVVFVSLPFLMLFMIAQSISSTGFLSLIFALGILTFIGVMLLYGTLWNVFSNAVWVLLFDRISTSKVFSKILRAGVWLTGGGRGSQ